MATKRKAAKPRLPSQTPVQPPQSVGDVLISACMADLNDKVAADYACGIYRKGDMAEKDRKSFANALFLFANLGWTYWNHAKAEKGE